MVSDSTTVFVLGAGFTKAFYPDAPLLVDNYNVDALRNKFQNNSRALSILDSEIKENFSRHINIENIFTRLYGGMPYDHEQERNNELIPLLSEVKKMFLDRITKAKGGRCYTKELATIAQYCVENNVTCITFNYDDFFDKALWEVQKVINLAPIQRQYWHPDGGYGFLFRQSICCVADTNITMDETSCFLLKLHGSLNWFIRLGHRMPYNIESVVHHQEWLPALPSFEKIPSEVIMRHLEPEPFMIPPVLTKSAIMEQPILRLVWELAYKALERAQHVVFIGYSLPTTDIDATFLFSEGLRHLRGSGIHIVNQATKTGDKNRLYEAYKRVFPWINKDYFEFRGALKWSHDLTKT